MKIIVTHPLRHNPINIHIAFNNPRLARRYCRPFNAHNLKLRSICIIHKFRHVLRSHNQRIRPLHIRRMVYDVISMNLHYLVLDSILKPFHRGNRHNHGRNAQRNRRNCQTHHIFGE